MRTMDLPMRGDRFGAGFASRLVATMRNHWRLASGAALLLVAGHRRSLAARLARQPFGGGCRSLSARAGAGQLCRGRRRDSARAGARRRGRCRRRRGGLGRALRRCERRLQGRRLRLCESGNSGGSQRTRTAPSHSCSTRPSRCIDALKANGIKIVSFANNHVMDQGWAGFAETREHLREQGLLFAGSGDTAQQSLAAGHRRGQRHQGRLAGHDALAQRQPQSR